MLRPLTVPQNLRRNHYAPMCEGLNIILLYNKNEI